MVEVYGAIYGVRYGKWARVQSEGFRIYVMGDKIMRLSIKIIVWLESDSH